MSDDNLVEITAKITSAHVANNSVAINDLPALIDNVYRALATLGAQPEPDIEISVPAVQVRNSIKPDYLVCFEDGARLKMLKRYLMRNYQMTPTDYRKKWKLPADYPMVAPNYSERRRALALEIGLGRKGRAPAPRSRKPRVPS